MAFPTDEQVQRLRASVRALRAPGVAQRAPAPTSSVFGRAAAAVPGEVRTGASREVLENRQRDVQVTAVMPGTSLILSVRPDAGAPPNAFLQLLQQLVDVGATAVVLADEVTRSVRPDLPITLPLRVGDSLLSEWAFIVCGPAKRVAFLGRLEPDGTWSWLLTRDPIAVSRSATAILERVAFLHLRVPSLVTDHPALPVVPQQVGGPPL